MKSYEQLHEALEACASRAREKDLTVGEVLDGLEDASYGFLCIVFSLPFLWPLTLGPLSIAGGLGLAALGGQMFAGRIEPWLPERLRRAVLPEKVWLALIAACLKMFTFCRKFTRPRGLLWVTGLRGRRIGGALIFTAGALMAVPFFGLPLNNTLPALAILSVCVAELEQDAWMLGVAVFWLAVTVAYFAAALWAIFVLGVNVTEWVGGLF